jgi:hypothetical protein
MHHVAPSALGLWVCAYGQQWFNDRRQSQLAQLAPLLGQAPEAMGPQDPKPGGWG